MGRLLGGVLRGELRKGAPRPRAAGTRKPLAALVKDPTGASSGPGMQGCSILCLSALALALGCSAAGTSDQSVGTEASGGNGGASGRGGSGTGGIAGVGVPDAGRDSSFGVDITVNDLVVEVHTLSCDGECANIEALVRGGNPPFEYQWNQTTLMGAGPHRVCPSSGTDYAVTVIDTSVRSGEILVRDSLSATGDVRIDVRSCPDGSDGGSSGDGGPTCVDVSWSNAVYCGYDPAGATHTWSIRLPQSLASGSDYSLLIASDGFFTAESDEVLRETTACSTSTGRLASLGRVMPTTGVTACVRPSEATSSVSLRLSYVTSLLGSPRVGMRVCAGCASAKP